MADTTFDCTSTLNVITKPAPGLNMIQHQNVKHLVALHYFDGRFYYTNETELVSEMCGNFSKIQKINVK